ncbi:C6 transcription factor [Penicillium lividum]|nr:C6 transcription factor [Penicillium lividum]
MNDQHYQIASNFLSTSDHCSGTPPCENCRAFQRTCIFDESLDQRRRVAAKRTADELGYHRDLLNDLFKLVREADETCALELLDIIRRNAPPHEVKSYINETLATLGADNTTPRETVAKLEDVRYLLNVEADGPAIRSKVMDIHYLCDEAPLKVPARPWTNVTDDADLVSNLVSLYFTWDYPFQGGLDQDVFLKHMVAGDLRSEFCSPYLVNAMLSNACYYSEFSEAYVVPGNIASKGCDFLAEAERLKELQSTQPSLVLLQGTLLMYERYAMSHNNDLGYITLHEAIRIGESLGLVGDKGPRIASDQLSKDMDSSCRRAAWGLFNIDTMVHTGFLRPCLIDHVNLPRIESEFSGGQPQWTPYPTHRKPRPSYLKQFLYEACNLSAIGHDISRSMFSGENRDESLQRQNREVLYERLRRWEALLPGAFASTDPPPHIILLRMRYNTLIINLFSCISESEFSCSTSEAPHTPESPPRPTPESKYNAWDVAQSAARGITELANIHRQEYGLSRAHQFAMYAINLALFTMLEQEGFDVLDPDFLSLASAFSIVASRSALGRNLFHMFRQSVRAKAQGNRIRGVSSISDELKDLFDEESTRKGHDRFDDYAEGLEKLNQEQKYHGIGEGADLQDYPGMGLSDMLDRYESLSLGKDDVFLERHRPTVAMRSQRKSPYQEPTPTSTGSYWAPHTNASPRSSVAPQEFFYTTPFTPHTLISNSFPTFGPTPSASSTDIGHTPDLVPLDKVAIPRLSSVSSAQARRRSARACESCRQRKTKCDGKRPTCGQCIYHNNRCVYEEVKRIRDENRIKSLTSRVEKYEKTLRSVETEVDGPTARKIRKVLTTKDGKSTKNPEDSDSSTSVGSLEDIDVVSEDLNRNEQTRAAGFFGKSSEVSWMQRLEDSVRRSGSREISGSPRLAHSEGHVDSALQNNGLARDIPIAMMNYHLDDLEIPMVDPQSDPLEMPPRERADEYFNAYMTFVNPFFSAVRQSTFTQQYLQSFSQPSGPPRKWLAVLNMIFAIGCRHCRLMNHTNSDVYDDHIVFLTRARQLSLHENVLFEHTGLQQIQLESLVAVYLLCTGQVNRASKFVNIAIHSAISLGINLRLMDERTDPASKEARCRLWWSIYSLEHLLTSMHGRVSGVGENLCSVQLPTPVEEENFDQPEIQRLFQAEQTTQIEVSATLFEKLNEPYQVPPWTFAVPPSPSLFFHYLVDLVLISQSVMNRVYSIEGIREGSTQTECRLQKYALRMDRWLSKLPPIYQFTKSKSSPWLLNHVQLDDETIPHTRERVCLALNYYSARITLCRPCLSLSHHKGVPQEHTSRAKLRAEMATNCLQASCSLISIFPERVDIAWLARVTPWWSVLHFLMQSTTALLLGLLYCSFESPDTGLQQQAEHATSLSGAPYPSLLDSDLNTALGMSKKALSWIHTMASVDAAARRAFLLCDHVVRRVTTMLKVDLEDWPSAATLGGEVGLGAIEVDSRMEGLEDLINFEVGGI